MIPAPVPFRLPLREFSGTNPHPFDGMDVVIAGSITATPRGYSIIVI
jgi:hypothetical protein